MLIKKRTWKLRCMLVNKRLRHQKRCSEIVRLDLVWIDALGGSSATVRYVVPAIDVHEPRKVMTQVLVRNLMSECEALPRRAVTRLKQDVRFATLGHQRP